uniref:Uncharacterized protein n=1 Tax=Oryza nivara TaxID=4536 RepID=A0A0G2KBP8_ORYNI
MHVSTCSNI